MSIVLNEYEWAKNAVELHELGVKPTETLGRVGKYYAADNYNKREVRDLLEKFLLQCDPCAQVVKWSDTLDKITNYSVAHKPIQIESIDVSVNEMARIESLDGAQMKRLAFTLLCDAKYWDAVRGGSGHWTNSKDRDIMKMANIKASIKRQSLLYHNLREAGLIRFSRKIDNLNVQVLFMEVGETAIHIHDFRNLGYQYLKYYGGPYFECSNCGLTCKKYGPDNSRPPKYCPECAIEIHTKQKVDSVMRGRIAAKS